MKVRSLLIAAILPAMMCSCSKKDEYVKETGFARGADVSWITEMEAKGDKFYTPGENRQEMECMQLLRDYCGVNSIRLRVWVNPEKEWNSIADVVKKAVRADSLKMRVMIDFHFSDTWADPGHQNIPEAWKDMPMEELTNAVANHVTETMTALKDAGVEPEWVQIGNETTPGMMHPKGHIDENPEQLVQLNNAGYDAVKAIFPNAWVIVHLDQGNDQARYDKMFEAFEKFGGKYDMIGMSLYPFWVRSEEDRIAGKTDNWQQVSDDCIANINYLKEKYKKPIMICEIGEHYSEGEVCRQLIEKMMKADVEGIFYWEPQAAAGYNGGYELGCFDNGAPTVALDPFKNATEQVKK